MANDSYASGGIGVSGLLGVAFVVLKLTGHITWSWWYVTLPFWSGWAIVLIVLAFGGVLHIYWNIAYSFKSMKKGIPDINVQIV
jgi:hypothetical protein